MQHCDNRSQPSQASFALYGVVFVISAAVLCMQFVHMRLLSLSMWNSLVYCVITIVLLGFSVSGAVLAVWKRAATIHAGLLISGAALGFIVFNYTGLFLLRGVEIDAARAIHRPHELFKLAVYFTALGLPYFMAGLAIGAAFFRYPAQVARLYFANMVGSGAGCLLFVCAFGSAGEKLIPLLSAAVSIAALTVVFRQPGIRILLVLALVASVVVTPFAADLFQVQICASKNLPSFQKQFPHAKIEHTQWTVGGRVDVLGGEGVEYLNRRTEERTPMKVLFTDGDAYTRMLNYSGSGNWRFRTKSFGTGAIYALRKPESVAVIGVGGGTEVRDAVEYGANRVVGVELNSAIFAATASIFADYNGYLAKVPGVELRHGEGRSFINTVPDGQFDLFYMSGVDTWAAMASGAYSLAENYLYTTEAIREYLRVLKPDGAISISRYAFRVPRESLRLGITVVEALRDDGVRDPWNHVAFLVDVDWGTIIALKRPFSDSEIATLESLQDKGYFKIAYRPGIENLRLTHENLARYGTDVWHPAPYKNALNPAVAFINAFKAGETKSYYANYPYDVTPCTDDRPFFFKHDKWRNLIKAPPQWAASGGSFANIVLGVLLLTSLATLLLLVFVPLSTISRGNDTLCMNARTLCIAAYFTALGIGYMAIEIVLMQKLTLFVAHPTYAIATILATMLTASGLGSLLSSRLRISPRRVIPIAISAIAALALLMQPATEYLLPFWLGQTILVRNLIAAAFVAPLAFFMGMPFPSGIRIVEQIAPALTPWAWGINGAAGVLSSLGAIAAATQLGFSAVLLASMVIYVVGGSLLLWGLRRELAPTI